MTNDIVKAVAMSPRKDVCMWNNYYINNFNFQLTYDGANACHKTILFKCDWFDLCKGTCVHKQYKLVEINHTRKYPKYDPHIRAPKGIKMHGRLSLTSRLHQPLMLCGRYGIAGRFE